MQLGTRICYFWRLCGSWVEGLLGPASPHSLVFGKESLVLAAGSRAGDGTGVHPRPGCGRHHRQEGPAHQTALPVRQRLHQGDLLLRPPGPSINSSPLTFHTGSEKPSPSEVSSVLLGFQARQVTGLTAAPQATLQTK